MNHYRDFRFHKCEVYREKDGSWKVFCTRHVTAKCWSFTYPSWALAVTGALRHKRIYG